MLLLTVRLVSSLQREEHASKFLDLALPIIRLQKGPVSRFGIVNVRAARLEHRD